MGLVWTSCMSDPTEVSILSCLASHANEDGESCFAGVPRIAKLVRRSERTVTRTLAALELAGWIEVERGDGAGNLTQYTINVDKLKRCQDVTLLGRSKRVTSAPKKGDMVTKKGDIGDNPPHPLLGRNVKANVRANTPPNPPLAQGACVAQENPSTKAAERESAIERAVDQVMQGLGVTKRRDRLGLRAVIAMEADKGESPPTTALAMMAAWRDQEAAVNRGELTTHFGVMNFFERGVWKNRCRWHWDEKLLRERAQARVGS